MARTRLWQGQRKSYRLREYDRPGKYEGGLLLDQYVAEQEVDDEQGNVSEDGVWYGLLRGDLVEGAVNLAIEHDDALTPEERRFLNDIAGAIVSETDQGFVAVSYYETLPELLDAWTDTVDEFGLVDDD